ncbi:hypothetical protein VFC49_06940 [Thermococcus sp. SY098]|uniref:hypothetical protein n=1 Tax=Thermococcus sp. SY098 TaxID=3111325 RepID=UPI002D76C434|nr:hypothetical protein [Thermococcus sp. SY098]WRS51821.1 hypothetical protein VFC49_06940 [Thermococcus sp. SY098]
MSYLIERLVKKVVREIPELEIEEIHTSPKKYRRSYIIDWAVLKDLKTGKNIQISYTWERGKPPELEVKVYWIEVKGLEAFGITLHKETTKKTIDYDVLFLLTLTSQISQCLLKEVKA